MMRQIACSTFFLGFCLAGTAFGSDLLTESKGKTPGPELNMKTSNVPQFPLIQKKYVNGKVELVRINKIPRLNLGEEDRIKAGSIAPLTIPSEKSYREISVVEKPVVKEIFVDQYVMKPIRNPAPAKIFLSMEQAQPTPEAPHPVAVAIPTPLEPKLSQDKIEEIPPAQMKLLQALIFLESKKDYNMALALFAELIDDKDVQTEATYQLALTAKNLGLYSEYKFRMMRVLNDKDKEWQKRATLSLAMSAAEGDKELVAILDPKLDSFKIELEKADQYQMNRAKYYLEQSDKNKGDLTKAFAAVDEILMDSPLYIDALFLKSLIIYKSGQFQEAIGIQQAVLKDVEEKRPESEFKSVVALTLARLHFQAQQYKEAFAMYLKVSKTNPEWLQAMIEQAWSQILSEDYEGAAGNMFSLHTDYFKKVFHPESYVVRTVGYLNLCQFGDGAKVVYEFKKKYSPVLKDLQEYQSKMKSNVNYYDTVKTWVKNSDLKIVDGLPREFIYALTRHPSFVLEQKMINATEDQVSKMNRISIDLIKTERKALTAQNDARAKLIEFKKRMDGLKDPAEKAQLKEQFAYQERRLMAQKIQHYIAKKARTSIKELRTQGLVRLEQEKGHFRDLAGLAVKTRFGQMLTKLNQSLDQGEVLQYELYSGAGEHLRFQLAGGDVNSKEHSELKVEDGKSLNWDFRGEIWEDELGHYRSGLKNVCAPDEPVKTGSN